MYNMPNITTSIPIEMWNLAKEKRIKWCEAIIRGIVVLIREGQRYEVVGERISDETIIAKKDKIIQNLTEALEKLQK